MNNCFGLGFNISQYLDSLPSNIREIQLQEKNLKWLPDLTRFTQLRLFSCSNNKLTSLPALPDSLETLFCSNNILTNLPALPLSLKELYCDNNKLTSLPLLPDNVLFTINCSNNQLTILPKIPDSLYMLYCYNNQINYIPEGKGMKILNCYNNPIYERIEYIRINYILSPFKLTVNYPSMSNYDFYTSNIKMLHKFIKFQETFYTIKYKNKFKKWLWDIRERKAIDKYSPENLLAILEKTKDEDYQDILDTW